MAAEIAVLMAAYNAERTLRQAVDSVRASRVPCDLFIVDDASRVPAAETLGLAHPSVEIVRLARNAGPAGARNAGLETIIARGYRYVAILDADDIAYPDRFAMQKAYLDTHPRVAAVGTAERMIDDETGALLYRYHPPCDPAAVRDAMFFNMALGHTTVMLRASALAELGLYSDRYPVAEDYELMRRLGRRFDLANLPECLTDYRISKSGVSLQRRRRQLFDRLCIQLKYFAPLNWRAWAGVGNTLMLFVVPRALVAMLKEVRGTGASGKLAASEKR
jgi:glycosyltransferase involved in cell wall biosynthesis